MTRSDLREAVVPGAKPRKHDKQSKQTPLPLRGEGIKDCLFARCSSLFKSRLPHYPIVLSWLLLPNAPTLRQSSLAWPRTSLSMRRGTTSLPTLSSGSRRWDTTLFHVHLLSQGLYINGNGELELMYLIVALRQHPRRQAEPWSLGP